jgi:hypothetical protein
MRVLLRFLREWSYVFVGAGHARDRHFVRGPLRQAQDRHAPVTILHLLQQIADCLLLVLLHPHHRDILPTGIRYKGVSPDGRCNRRVTSASLKAPTGVAPSPRAVACSSRFSAEWPASMCT